MSDLTDNHSHERVPDDESVSGLRIAIISVGVTITLPAFLVGASMLSALGLVGGALAIFMAGFILACIALGTMYIASQTKLSTYTLIQFSFGRLGSRLINIILAFTLIGWYGITAVLFGDTMAASVTELLSLELPAPVFVVAGSALMIGTTIFGFRAIDTLARLAVPLLAVLMLIALWMLLKDSSVGDLLAVTPVPHDSLSSVATGVSVIIGSFIVGVTLTPDIARFARHSGDAWSGAILSYAIGSPLVLFLAGIPVLAIGEPDLVATMVKLGLGIPALLVMVLATWTSNVSNLYGSSLSLAQLATRTRDWIITLTAGVLGTAFALAGIMDYFIDFLVLLGVVVPPITGIYLVDYFVTKRGRIGIENIDGISDYRWKAIISWALASSFGILANLNDWSITSLPALDTLLLGALILYLLEK